MIKAQEIIETMEAMRNDVQRQNLMRFFKTGKGQYGEGDEFLGLKNPETRAVVDEIGNISLEEIHILLMSHWHEVRLCGFLLLVKMAEGATKKKPTCLVPFDDIVDFYFKHAERANNWDLVDLSAPKIVGRWLLTETRLTDDEKIATLDAFATSDCLWKQRIAMVSTWWTSHYGNPFYGLRYAEMLLTHPHDLMHKAVGWMLRELGKGCSMDLLRDFLEKNIHRMPRTTLRYAIEKMPPAEREYWMKKH